MKKIKLFLLFIILLIPMITNAHDIEDLEFKWKALVDFDEFYNLNSKGEPYDILYNDQYYMTLAYDNITWIDKLTGDTFKYRIQNYKIEEINNEKYVLGQRDSDTHILKLDNNLEIEKKLVLKEQQSHSLIIKDEKIITITYKKINDNSYEYLVNIYDQELNLLENHSTKIPTRIYSCGDKKHSFRDNYDKHYYLDEDYKIVPYIVKENGDYTVFDGYKISNVDKNGNITKEYQISTSNYSAYYRETSDKKYVLINNRTYTTSNQYNSEVILYVFDDELNLLTQKVLGTKSNHYYYNGISGNLYLNKNEIVIYVDGKYYKLDSSYNLIETTSSEAENSFQLSYEEYEDDDYYFDEEYYDNEREIEEELENYAKENISKDTDIIFDYVKYKNNYYASVTWRYDCYNDSEYNYYCYTSDDFIKFDSNFNIKKVKKHSPEKLLKNEDGNYYGLDNLENIVREFNGYLIMAAGGPFGNSLILYDTDLNNVKIFNGIVGDSELEPRSIVTSKNGFVLINNRTESETLINQDTMEDAYNDYSEFYYFEFPYEIRTEVTGKGSIEVSEDKTRAGEHVKFTVTPEKGYVLSEVKVTDSEGNVLIFTDYEFTMPTADVLIEAKFVPEILENPATKDSIIIIVLFLMSLYFINKHIRNTKKELI